MSRFHIARQKTIPDMLLVCGALSDYSGIVGRTIPKKDADIEGTKFNSLLSNPVNNRTELQLWSRAKF